MEKDKMIGQEFVIDKSAFKNKRNHAIGKIVDSQQFSETKLTYFLRPYHRKGFATFKGKMLIPLEINFIYGLIKAGLMMPFMDDVDYNIDCIENI